MVKTIWADYKEEWSKTRSRCIAISQYRLKFFLEVVRLLLVSHQSLGAESIYKVLEKWAGVWFYKMFKGEIEF